MPKVSVVIPTCNRARLVRRAVQSVLWQTHADLEVIVVDDASTDDTAAVVRRIGDPRVRYLRHDSNRGLSAARNTGIRQARGAYIAFLDDDDIWLPQKLEKQLQCFEASDRELGAVHCGFLRLQTAPPYRAFVPSGPWSLAGDILMKLLGWEGYVVTVALIVPAAVIEEVGGFDEAFVREEDTDFILRIAARYQFGFVPESLVIVHDTPGSLMKDHDLVFEMRRRVLEKHQGLYAGHPEVLAQRLAYEAHECLDRGDADRAAALIDRALLVDPDSASAREVFLRLRHPTLWRLETGAKAVARALARYPTLRRLGRRAKALAWTLVKPGGVRAPRDRRGEGGAKPMGGRSPAKQARGDDASCPGPARERAHARAVPETTNDE